jgi:S1-C subfamily serine protease
MLALLSVAAMSGTIRADEEPQGMIGIQIKMDAENKDGKLVIIDVISDSPAEKAGLKKDDVLVKVNDKVADDLQETVKEIVSKKPGTKIKIVVKRDGKEKTIEVEVGKRMG